MTYPPKILGLVTNCAECPNYGYYSGGTHECKLVGEIVRDSDKDHVASFCPLPDYPSRKLAEQEATIRGMREGFKRDFSSLLLTYVACKLNLNLAANGIGLTIPFQDRKESREVYFGFDHIKEVKMWPLEIVFLQSGGAFRLCPDASPPTLSERTEVSGKEGWILHRLAT